MTRRTNCDARLAHLLYRGMITGVIWTIAIDGYEHISRVQSGATNLNIGAMGRAAARNSGTFAIFLGTFGGVSCVAESLRGRKDWKNTFLGGFSSGLLLSMYPKTSQLPMRASLVTATICGTFASVFGEFSPNE
jgi:hypothetical protein